MYQSVDFPNNLVLPHFSNIFISMSCNFSHLLFCFNTLLVLRDEKVKIQLVLKSKANRILVK